MKRRRKIDIGILTIKKLIYYNYSIIKITYIDLYIYKITIFYCVGACAGCISDFACG